MLKKTILFTSFMALIGCEGGTDANPLDANLGDTNTAVATVITTGEQVPYEIVGELAITQGDVLLGTHAEVQANGIKPVALSMDTTPATCNDDNTACSAITGDSDRRWGGGVVPYTFGGAINNAVAAEIFAAMDEFESNTSIRFVKRIDETDYVQFSGPPNNSKTCSATVGKRGGRQYAYITEGVNCVAHEIGHVIGLSHEHNRSDRDTYINIDFTNVASSGHSAFDKLTSSDNVDEIGTYDVGSLMHYDAYTGAINTSKPVITSKKGVSISNVGGTNEGKLTSGDIAGISSLYGSGSTTYYSMRKANAFSYAIDGAGLGQSANKSNVYLWTYSSSNKNQHFEEIARSGGYYSYRNRYTGLCIDGQGGGGNRQNVYLYDCGTNNYNQHFKKYASGSYVRLQKRNSSGYSLDGGNGGSKGQNLYLYSNGNNNNGNQYWYLTREN